MFNLIKSFDTVLCRINGVYEFSEHPDCILRLQHGKASHPIEFNGTKIAKGISILHIHLWNERMPPVNQEGPDLLWARRFFRLFVFSLQEAASYLSKLKPSPEFEAVGGTTSILFNKDNPASEYLLNRLGFSLIIWKSRLGHFGEFWENAYAWSLLWTYNPQSLKSKRFKRMQRVEFWMSWEKFQTLYRK
jgi:hypothetical protein